MAFEASMDSSSPRRFINFNTFMARNDMYIFIGHDVWNMGMCQSTSSYARF